MPRRSQPAISPAALDDLIEQATTVDCYNESEQVTGLFTMLEEHLDLPFETTLLRMAVTATSIRSDRRRPDRRDLQTRWSASTDPDPRSTAPHACPGRLRMDRGLSPLATLTSLQCDHECVVAGGTQMTMYRIRS
jgi:hypothetical protein